MLVRSLGWVQLPQEKEKMVDDVARALDSLGVKYQVVKGELSDVVWVGEGGVAGGESGAFSEPVEAHGPPPLVEASGFVGVGSSVASPSSSEAASGGGVPRFFPGGRQPKRRYTEGQLTVRLHIEPSMAGGGGGGGGAAGSAASWPSSSLHISRHAGDVLQFHSFYRDVRNQLAGANGWTNKKSRYEHAVTSSV